MVVGCVVFFMCVLFLCVCVCDLFLFSQAMYMAQFPPTPRVWPCICLSFSYARFLSSQAMYIVGMGVKKAAEKRLGYAQGVNLKYLPLLFLHALSVFTGHIHCRDGCEEGGGQGFALLHALCASGPHPRTLQLRTGDYICTLYMCIYVLIDR